MSKFSILGGKRLLMKWKTEPRITRSGSAHHKWSVQLLLMAFLVISVMIRWIFTTRVCEQYIGFALCVSVRLSIRAQKVHLKGSKLLKLTWKLVLGMLGMRSSHVRDHPMVSVHLTDTFWDRLGCVRGFLPFNGLCLTPNHFQTLPGHADKKTYLYPPLPASSLTGGGLCDPALSWF